jgi:hypothetical protein
MDGSSYRFRDGRSRNRACPPDLRAGAAPRTIVPPMRCLLPALVAVAACAGKTVTPSADASGGADAHASDAPSGPSDATPDAPLPDARTPDAMSGLPDAAAPDASVSGPDGAAPDAGAPGIELTVSKAPDATGRGTVTSTPAGLVCGPGCALVDATFPSGTRVSLEARPLSGSYFAGWTGACLGQGRVCTISLTKATTARVRFSIIDHNLAFVTSDRFAGDLGGLEGADGRCAAAAAEAGLSGTFVALLSTPDVPAADRLGPARGFIRLDGRPVADKVSDLFTRHALLYPVLYDQDGRAIHSSASGGEDMTWTGTTPAGTSPNTCDGWTDMVSGKYGNAGQPGGGPAAWLDAIAGQCDAGGVWGDNRLYCFMVDLTDPIIAPAATGKVIYVTASAFPLTNGRIGADQLCDQEKPPGVNTVRALLATTDASAASVLDVAAAYVRPDGVLVGTGADLIAASRGDLELASGIWQTSDGGYVAAAGDGGRYAWTGVAKGASLASRGTAAATCDDWAAPDQSKTGATGDYQYRDETAFANSTSPCFANVFRLFCVEE